MRILRLVASAIIVAFLFAAAPARASAPVHRGDVPERSAAALKADADPAVDPAPAPVVDPAPSDLPVRDNLCFRLSEHWTLHPLASLAVMAYDVTHRNFIGEMNISGLYEARYKDTAGFALGVGFQTGPAVGATVSGLVTLPYHLAAGAQYQ